MTVATQPTPGFSTSLSDVPEQVFEAEEGA